MSTRTRQGRRMSLQGLARLLGRNRNTLASWISQGCPAQPSTGGRGVEWSLDPAEVVAWLVDRERLRERERLESKHRKEIERLQLALQKIGEGEPISLEEGKRREQAARAHLAELDLAEREGSLIRRERAEADSDAALSLARQHLLALEVKLAPLVASVGDVAECGRLIRDGLYRAMHEVADAGADVQVMRHDDGAHEYLIRVEPRNANGEPVKVSA